MDDIKAEDDDRDSQERSKPPRQLGISDPNAGKSLDYGLEQVPEKNGDGERDEKGSSVGAR